MSFKVQDLMSLAEHETFDFIFSIDCLEHIPGNQKVVANLVQALAPGGILYVAMPCEKSIDSFSQSAISRNIFGGRLANISEISIPAASLGLSSSHWG